MKKKLGPSIANYPMPLILAGTNVNGKANFLAVAWFTMANYQPLQIAIVLGKMHHTNEGIKENKTFSVCIPSTKQIESVDYCGLVSGKQADKSKIYDVFYGDLKTAPMISEFGLNYECELLKVVDNGANEMFIGAIKEAYADETILKDGKPDISLIDPVLCIQNGGKYYNLGKPFADAWSVGKKYQPKN